MPVTSGRLPGCPEDQDQLRDAGRQTRVSTARNVNCRVRLSSNQETAERAFVSREAGTRVYADTGRRASPGSDSCRLAAAIVRSLISPNSLPISLLRRRGRFLYSNRRRGSAFAKRWEGKRPVEACRSAAHSGCTRVPWWHLEKISPWYWPPTAASATSLARTSSNPFASLLLDS